MYENILKAMGESDSTLSYEDQANNYSLFSELMKKGVKLQDLIDKANAPKVPAIDEGLFSAMENAVQNVLEVKSAKKAQNDVVKCIIMRLCANDPEYQKVTKEYRDAVIKAYTDKKGGEGSEGDPSSPDKKNLDKVK